MDAWIDFNRNGEWEHPEEYLDLNPPGPLPDGTHMLELIEIPPGAEPQTGDTFARFRLSTLGGLTPEGRAEDGEVEDYPVTFTP